MDTTTSRGGSESLTDRCPPAHCSQPPCWHLCLSLFFPAGLTPALSWQSLTAALAVRRFKDLTFQEEYSTLFPTSAQP